MIVEKLKYAGVIKFEITDNNKMLVGIAPNTEELTKKDFCQLIFELNELAIKMK